AAVELPAVAAVERPGSIGHVDDPQLVSAGRAYLAGADLESVLGTPRGPGPIEREPAVSGIVLINVVIRAAGINHVVVAASDLQGPASEGVPAGTLLVHPHGLVVGDAKALGGAPDIAAGTDLDKLGAVVSMPGAGNGEGNVASARRISR